MREDWVLNLGISVIGIKYAFRGKQNCNLIQLAESVIYYSGKLRVSMDIELMLD